MRKYLTAFLSVLVLSVSLLCLFGCSVNVDGKYMLTNAGGQSGNGAVTNIIEMNDYGEYVNVS